MFDQFLHKNKDFAYILREYQGKDELLIFAHRDYPAAGLQVPAGTVEEGEELEAAVQREVLEESGLEDFSEIHYVGIQDFIHEGRSEIPHRSFYLLIYSGKSPREFSFEVKGSGTDRGLVFNYSWIALDKLPKLIADHDILVPELREYLAKKRRIDSN